METVKVMKRGYNRVLSYVHEEDDQSYDEMMKE